MTALLQHFINGKLTLGHGKRRGDIYNPSTGKKAKEVTFANTEDLEITVAIARSAQIKWAAVTPLRRARVLFKFNDLIEQHLDKLSELIANEHGKVLEDARGEVIRGKEVVEFACGAPHLLKAHFSENVGSHVDCHTARYPVGVCAGITPFNFPAMVPLWMYPIALVCGNAFILKPSEKDPSVSNYFAELLQEAGLPDGLFNVLHGDKEVVDAILDHPDIDAVSFVGSTPIARHVYERGCKTGKRVQALGGAKNHCIIMPDADIDTAVSGLMGAAFGSAGQRCMAISVAVLVGDQLADAVVVKLMERIQTLKVLPSMAKGAEMGPLVTREHWKRVVSYVETGVREGATLLADGRDIIVPDGEKGFFLGPCLFDHVIPDMRIYQEEIFGPVLALVRVPDFEAAVQLINDNPYGNGTAIYTKNGAAARNFAHRIKVGMVGINVPIPVPMAFHSFGGWKDSLFGDTHMHGPEGFHFYTRMKTITSRWPEDLVTRADFVMPTM